MHPSRPMLTAHPGNGEPWADSTIGHGAAHAKAILFGEHAVVYGAPALAIPVTGLRARADMRLTPPGSRPGRVVVRLESELFSGDGSAAPARLQPVLTAAASALATVGLAGAAVHLRIRSEIPPERGLGSSAAVAAAVARSAADLAGTRLGPEPCFEIVQEAERVAHGTPSGLDARAVAADRLIRFERGVVTPVPLVAPLSFVIADSGSAGSTATAVAGVRRRREDAPAAVDRVIAALATLAEEAEAALIAADLPAVGAQMTEAHAQLRRLGVSSDALDGLVAAADAGGALGAKLTGAGFGGCVIALARSDEHAAELAVALRRAGAPRSWVTTAEPA